MKKFNLAKTLLTGAVVALMTVGFTACKKDSDPDRKKFIGSYNSTSTCLPGATWTTTIAESSTGDENVVISNLGNEPGLKVNGTASGNNVTIASQTAVDGAGDTWTIEGTCAINNNIITSTIKYTFGSTTYTCSETWTKQ